MSAYARLSVQSILRLLSPATWQAEQLSFLKPTVVKEIHVVYTQVGNLSTCPALVRLDLSRNQLGSLAGLETCPQLKWLSASGNALNPLLLLPALSNLRVGPSTARPSPTAPPVAFLWARAPVLDKSLTVCLHFAARQHMPMSLPLYCSLGHRAVWVSKPTCPAVQVLNLSFCSLSGALDVAGLTSLRALILNDNTLESVTGAFGPPGLPVSAASPCWSAASLQASKGTRHRCFLHARDCLVRCVPCVGRLNLQGERRRPGAPAGAEHAGALKP